MQRSVTYIIIIFIIVMASCSRRPSYIIPERKMMDVLYDIQLSQAIFRNSGSFNSDEGKDALVEGVLKKHKITQAELDSSLVWYSDNIQYYMTITDTVSARLKKNSERFTALKNEFNAKTRNWDNYIIPPFFYLNKATPTLSFSIDSSKIQTIDIAKFNIKFDVQGLNENQDIEAAVFYKYKDTLVTTVLPIDSNTHYRIVKPQLADSLLKSISGYIHMRNGKAKWKMPDVLLYNISYSDSIQMDSLNTQNESDPKSRDVTLDGVDRSKIRRDKMPILSKERIDSSPTMRRSKKGGSGEPQNGE